MITLVVAEIQDRDLPVIYCSRKVLTRRRRRRGKAAVLVPYWVSAIGRNIKRIIFESSLTRPLGTISRLISSYTILKSGIGPTIQLDVIYLLFQLIRTLQSN